MTTTDDLLSAGPAIRAGTLVGYGRVSTKDQNLDRQTLALTEAGRIRVFTDKKSGKNVDRPELAACLDYLRPGDTLVVLSLDRLARSLQDLITIVGELRRRDIGFTSLHERLDTTTPGGRLVFHVFAALAEFVRIPDGVRLAIEDLEARTGEFIGGCVEQLMDLPDPTVVTYQWDAEYRAANPGSPFSASWHRAVVARIAQEVPGLSIVYPGPHPARGEHDALPSRPTP